MNWIDFVKNLLIMLTVFSNVVAFVLLVTWTGSACFPWVRKYWKKIYKFILNNGLYLGLLISFTAMIGSLFYSDIVHYAPCKLCWYQRVLMYPQVIIFSVAIGRKKIDIAESAKWLSLIGVFMSLYHYSLQVAPVKTDTCLSVGYSASCSDNFSMNLGYITIPFMAFSAFLLIFVFTTIALQKKK